MTGLSELFDCESCTKLSSEIAALRQEVAQLKQANASATHFCEQLEADKESLQLALATSQELLHSQQSSTAYDDKQKALEAEEYELLLSLDTSGDVGCFDSAQLLNARDRHKPAATVPLKSSHTGATPEPPVRPRARAAAQGRPCVGQVYTSGDNTPPETEPSRQVVLWSAKMAGQTPRQSARLFLLNASGEPLPEETWMEAHTDLLQVVKRKMGKTRPRRDFPLVPVQELPYYKLHYPQLFNALVSRIEEAIPVSAWCEGHYKSMLVLNQLLQDLPKATSGSESDGSSFLLLSSDHTSSDSEVDDSICDQTESAKEDSARSGPAQPHNLVSQSEPWFRHRLQNDSAKLKAWDQIMGRQSITLLKLKQWCDAREDGVHFDHAKKRTKQALLFALLNQRKPLTPAVQDFS